MHLSRSTVSNPFSSRFARVSRTLASLMREGLILHILNLFFVWVLNGLRIFIFLLTFNISPHAVSYFMFINFIHLLIPIPTPFQYLTVDAWTSSMTTPSKQTVVVDLQGLDAAACLLVKLPRDIDRVTSSDRRLRRAWAAPSDYMVSPAAVWKMVSPVTLKDPHQQCWIHAPRGSSELPSRSSGAPRTTPAH